MGKNIPASGMIQGMQNTPYDLSSIDESHCRNFTRCKCEVIIRRRRN
jgi:hypothetical protein